MTCNYLEVEINFPQDENGMPKAPATEVLRYGFFPPIQGETPIRNPSEPPLQAGDRTITGIKNYERLLDLLDYAGHSRIIQEVTIEIRKVIFADGTMWMKGSLFRRDLTDPKKWVNILSQVGLSRQSMPINWLVFNSKQTKFLKISNANNLTNARLPTLIQVAQIDEPCQGVFTTVPLNCNNYACHADDVIADNSSTSQYPADQTWKFREQVERCYRDDNNQDCFAFNNVQRNYFNCGSTAGGYEGG